jgi:hypothetical protein
MTVEYTPFNNFVRLDITISGLLCSISLRRNSGCAWTGPFTSSYQIIYGLSIQQLDIPPRAIPLQETVSQNSTGD